VPFIDDQVVVVPGRRQVVQVVDVPARGLLTVDGQGAVLRVAGPRRRRRQHGVVAGAKEDVPLLGAEEQVEEAVPVDVPDDHGAGPEP
jgi:hypothetical protein